MFHFTVDMSGVKMLPVIRTNLWCLVLLINLLFLGCSIAQFGQGVGQSCRLNSGGSGVCKDFDDCDLNLLQKEGSNPAICGWSGEDAIVCCPSTVSTIQLSAQQPQQSGQGSRPPNNAQLSVSQQKCEEYKQIKCSGHTSTHTIIGGTVVESVEDFPHQVLIGYGDVSNPSWECGGTLISEQWVLTAAHCLSSRRGQAVRIDVGFLNKNNRNREGKLQSFTIIERVKHPDRKNPAKYADIALLKLDRPAILSRFVLPACLHNTADIPTSSAIATGWGDTEYAANRGSTDLMQVSLSILEHSECSDLFKANRHLVNGIREEQQFCAGEPKKDTCQGDSGGPLQITHANLCMRSIIGVTSFGNLCGVKAGVYTRVSHYLPWIEQVVWSNNN